MSPTGPLRIQACQVFEDEILDEKIAAEVLQAPAVGG